MRSTLQMLEVTALAVSLSDGAMAMSEALHHASTATATTMTRKGTIAALPMAHEINELRRTRSWVGKPRDVKTYRDWATIFFAVTRYEY